MKRSGAQTLTLTSAESYLPSAGPCHLPTLSDAQFNVVLASIREKSFEASRLSLAQEVILGNCLNCHQLRQLLELFTFERTRLELARQARQHIVDPQNLEQVYTVFDFPSSLEELRSGSR